MKNNDILRRLRYLLDVKDTKLMAIYALVDPAITINGISGWLKSEDDPAYQACKDVELATFLNGLIIHLRGKREGEQPVAEKQLNNNIILRKLKIAFNLKAEDMLELLKLAGFKLSKHELSAFFRRPDHPHYRECKDQVLRNFLMGLQQRQRPAQQGDKTQPW